MKKLLVGIEKLGNRGSTLIAVLVVTTILSLFIVTMQPMMLSYASRSIDERDVKQAELSAKSANDAVVQAVLDGNTTLLGVINGMTNDLDIRFLSNFRFGLDETGKDRHKTMGTIEAKILRVEANRFSVITMATVGLKTWTIARELSKTTTGGEALSGALPAYYFFTVSYTNGGGFQVSGTTPVMVNSNFSLTNKGEISVGGDLIIQDSSITFNGNPTKMQIDGNLYTTSGSFAIPKHSLLTLNGQAYTLANSPISRTGTGLRYCADIYSTSTIATRIAEYAARPSWYNTSGTIYNSGLTLQGGTYYTISATQTIADISSQFAANVTPDNPVYIVIKGTARLTNTNTIDGPIGGVPQDPRIVFILEGSGYLYLKTGTSAVVYGNTSGSRLYVTNPGSNTSILYGQIRVGTMYNYDTKEQILLNYRAAGSPVTTTWEAGIYSKAKY